MHRLGGLNNPLLFFKVNCTDQYRTKYYISETEKDPAVTSKSAQLLSLPTESSINPSKD